MGHMERTSKDKWLGVGEGGSKACFTVDTLALEKLFGEGACGEVGLDTVGGAWCLIRGYESGTEYVGWLDGGYLVITVLCGLGRWDGICHPPIAVLVCDVRCCCCVHDSLLRPPTGDVFDIFVSQDRGGVG